MTETEAIDAAGRILEHALGNEMAEAVQRATELEPDTLGDWCVRCADDEDVDPVRFPRMLFGGLAVYICHRCGHSWRCWWAIEGAS